MNVGISVLGGTAVSIENKDKERKMSERGFEILIERVFSPLEEEGYKFDFIGDMIFTDSANLTTEQRNKGFKEAVKYLYQPENLGVVMIHGTGTLQTTGAMGWWGIKYQKKPFILTGSKKPASNQKSDIIKHTEDAVRIIGSSRAPSIMGIYFYKHLMTPFSRWHDFHTHNVYFVPSDIVREIGIVEGKKFIPHKQYEQRDTCRYLDATLEIPFTKTGNIRPPLIQEYKQFTDKDWLELRSAMYPMEMLSMDPMEIFLIEFALLMNKINNSNEESRKEKWYPMFWDLVKRHNVDGERLFKSFGKLGQQYYEPFFDYRGVAEISYRTDPNLYIPGVKNDKIKGVVIECSGGGEVNLSGLEGSHIRLLKALNEKKIPFVLTPKSDAPYAFSPYQSDLIKKYHGISGGFKRSDECHVKLSKLVHHEVKDMMKDVSEHYNVPLPLLTHIMFVGGGEFIPEERVKYTKITKVPTLVDLMDTNFPIELGLNLAGEYASKTYCV